MSEVIPSVFPPILITLSILNVSNTKISVALAEAFEVSKIEFSKSIFITFNIGASGEKCKPLTAFLMPICFL
ncbi:hypothetical protein ACFS5M_06840 [Lacinutrix iliipiscaria]|uniref:Secreted protein n=1 Tax=Lacinutrix iliipiscaria TaxID=1230532 RepID=A0ABW5WMG0_9FLAO